MTSSDRSRSIFHIHTALRSASLDRRPQRARIPRTFLRHHFSFTAVYPSPIRSLSGFYATPFKNKSQSDARGDPSAELRAAISTDNATAARRKAAPFRGRLGAAALSKQFGTRGKALPARRHHSSRILPRCCPTSTRDLQLRVGSRYRAVAGARGGRFVARRWGRESSLTNGARPATGSGSLLLAATSYRSPPASYVRARSVDVRLRPIVERRVHRRGGQSARETGATVEFRSAH